MCERILVWFQSSKFRLASDYKRWSVAGLQESLHHLTWPPFHRPLSLLPPFCCPLYYPPPSVSRRLLAVATLLVARRGTPCRPDQTLGQLELTTRNNQRHRIKDPSCVFSLSQKFSWNVSLLCASVASSSLIHLSEDFCCLVCLSNCNCWSRL